ncbi:hypothetical protein JXA56_01335 [Candidatus Micrarchaeota archaeon]|nr:hypothetical protein [Candidatus Micrarchaeota archaeon]
MKFESSIQFSCSWQEQRKDNAGTAAGKGAQHRQMNLKIDGQGVELVRHFRPKPFK